MNRFKQIFNIGLDGMQFWMKVFVAGILLSAIFFFFAIGNAKTNRSEISILVTVKSPVAVQQQAQIISNIVELPKTLAFYDRMLKNNPNVRDVAAGLSPAERKQKWNEMISVEKASDNASVFKIVVTTKRQSDSEQLAAKTARTLFDTVAFYYDIQKDFDLRIIDGPISKAQIPGVFGIFAASVALGFGLAVLIAFLFFMGKNRLMESGELFKKNFFADFGKKTEMPAEKEIESLENLYQSEQVESPFVFEDEQLPMQETVEQSLPENDIIEKPVVDPRFEEMKKLTKQIEPDKYPNFPEMPLQENRTASAPANLPIAEDEFFDDALDLQLGFSAEEIKTEISKPAFEEETFQTVEEEQPVDPKREPTPEELKKRLNQLLRGEI